MQRLAGDTAGAKVTVERARNTIEQCYREEPGTPTLRGLSLVYALMGEKDLSLKRAERAVCFASRGVKIRCTDLSTRRTLALIQTMIGENQQRDLSSHAPVTNVLWGPGLGATSVTPALLRLDPVWDPLRVDPAFQKLCEEKQRLPR